LYKTIWDGVYNSLCLTRIFPIW